MIEDLLALDWKPILGYVIAFVTVLVILVVGVFLAGLEAGKRRYGCQAKYNEAEREKYGTRKG